MRVLIIGAGAQAKYIIEISRIRADFDVVGMIDLVGEAFTERRVYDGVSVLGGIEKIDEFPPSKSLKVMVACANNKQKQELVNVLNSRGYEFHTAVHPSAIIAGTAGLGSGSIINPGCIVQPFAKIGNHVMIHCGSIIEHDNVIEDFVNIGPRSTLAGWVTVKQRSTLFTGSVVIPNVTVNEDAIVGASALVRNDVAANTTVIGIPATELSHVR